MFHPSATQSAAEATRKLLANLWQKNLPVLQERLAALAGAAEAAELGSLTDEQRHEAGSTAHKLAGSLGMFGYPKGTEIARGLEQRFDSTGPLQKAGLTEKVTALRRELGLSAA